jgi:hypothetical protein
MKFRKKPVVVEAITFDELVAHGRTQTEDTNGMPWSFEYGGHPVTHESDECYLIPTLEGIMGFTPADMLITGVEGEIYPCKKLIFDATYEPAMGPIETVFDPAAERQAARRMAAEEKKRAGSNS